MEIYCRTSGLPFAESLIARNPEIPGVVERQSGSPQKRNSIVAAKTTQIGSFEAGWITEIRWLHGPTIDLGNRIVLESRRHV